MTYSYNNICDKAEPEGKERLEQLCTEPPHNVPTSCQEVDGARAITFGSVLTGAECTEFIQVAEEVGFTFWNTATDEAEVKAKREFRVVDTIEVNCPSLTGRIWRRLEPFFADKELEYNEELPDFETDIEGLWVPSHLNENCLIGRYGDGGHFAPHVDGCNITTLNERSMFTILIYLNDCAKGGETLLIDATQCEVLTKDERLNKVVGNGQHVVASVQPTAGNALCFYHNQTHEGRPVAPGHVKYILRMDVMYRRMPPICDAPADREAFDVYQRARVVEASGDAMEAMRLFRSIRKLSPGVADLYGL